MAPNKLLGAVLAAASISFLVYYTLWVIVTVHSTQPFIDYNHWVQDYFPRKEYALIIPTVSGVVLMVIVSTFVGIVFVRDL